MRRALLVFFVLWLTSCYDGPVRTTPVIDRGAALERQRVLYAYTVSETCDGRQAGVRTQNVLAPIDRRTVLTQPCGLITVDVAAPSYVQAFVQGPCGGVDDGACGEGYRKMAVARFVERYTLADLPMLGNRCAAYPLECGRLDVVERWFMESHNAIARARYDEETAYAAESARLEAAQRQREAEVDHLRRRQAVAAALKGFADGFQAARPIHCTTTHYGYADQTTCQ